MNLWELFVLSVALGTDLVSVSLPLGMQRLSMRRIVAAGLVFAWMHILLLLLGYYTGHWLGHTLQQLGMEYECLLGLGVQDWLALIGAAVLAVIGLHMLQDAWQPERSAAAVAAAPLRGLALWVVAFSVSIDALAAGVSLGVLDLDLWRLSAVLGSVIFLLAIISLRAGSHLGRRLGSRAGFVGGAMLLALAGHMLQGLW